MIPDPPEHHDDESSPPIDGPDVEQGEFLPPRFWWLKRLGLAAAVLVILSFGLHIWATHQAKSRLDALIERHRAAGEPIDPQDFNPTDPPSPEENAAPLYLAAEAYFDANRGFLEEDMLRRSILDEVLETDMLGFAPMIASLESVLAANARTFQLVRQARSRTRVDWGVRHATPLISVPTRNMSPSRELCHLLAIAAGYQARKGNDEEVVEMLHDLVVLARRQRSEDQAGFFPHMVSSSCLNIAADAVESVLPRLDRPMPQKAISGLIAALLNEKPELRGWDKAFMYERAQMVDLLRIMESGKAALPGTGGGVWTPPAVLFRVTLKPVWIMDAIGVFELYTLVGRTGTMPDYQTARGMLPIPQRPATNMQALLNPVSTFTFPVDRFLQSEYTGRTDVRMAAVALAIRWYELDHGHRPAKLSELVPHYLDSIPADPFASDGRDIAYLPDGQSPILYSVYLNEFDDGGDYIMYSGGGVDRGSRHISDTSFRATQRTRAQPRPSSFLFLVPPSLDNHIRRSHTALPIRTH